MRPQETLDQIQQGSRNVRFADFVRLVEAFGFHLDRTRGSHWLFSREGIPERINLQQYQGQAKPYQIRQFLKLVQSYRFKLEQER